MAAITPLKGGVVLELKGLLQKANKIGEEDLVNEANSQLATAITALTSKARFMKKLHRKGRGPKATIRRFLGGEGVAVGPSVFRVIPSSLLLFPDYLADGCQTDNCVSEACGKTWKTMLLLARNFCKRLDEESKTVGQQMLLEAPWHPAGLRSFRNHPETPLAASRAAVNWSGCVDFDPLMEWFKGDAEDRMAFIRMVMEALPEKGHVS